MTGLPQQISIFNINIQTLGIFLLLGFLLFVFVVWQEGRKDGFDEEKLFDLVIISLLGSVILSRIVFGIYNSLSFGAMIDQIYKVWEPGYSLNGALVGFLITVIYLCDRWKWSIYRVLDVFALGSSLALSIIFLSYVGIQGRFDFLFGFAAWLFLYVLLSRFRNSKIKSGYGFSIFVAVSGLITLIFFRNLDNLIFYGLLVTLSAVVFLYRWKLTNYESKFIRRLIKSVKTRTSKQEKNL